MRKLNLFMVFSFMLFCVLGIVKISYAKICCDKGFVKLLSDQESCEDAGYSWVEDTDSECTGLTVTPNTTPPPAPRKAITLQDPLGIGGKANSGNEAQVLIGRVIQTILGLVGSIALLMFVYGGFLWMIAAGNDERVKKGKDVLVWASLGLAIIFASYILVFFILKTLLGLSG